MGGWVRSNAYVCLHGGWVGLAKCLRNQKNHWKTDFLKTPIDKGQKISKAIFLANHSCKNWRIFLCLILRFEMKPPLVFTHCHFWKSIFWGWVGFQKSYVIFRVGHDKWLRVLTRWMGGVKKGHKYANVILKWSLIDLTFSLSEFHLKNSISYLLKYSWRSMSQSIFRKLKAFCMLINMFKALIVITRLI